MSGTSASIGGDAGGLGLPAPVVRLGKGVVGVRVVESSVQSDAIRGIECKNTLTVSAHGLPKAILEDVDTFKPQLELMRYVRRRSSQQLSRSFANNGYVHPAHGPGSSGNGSWTHGGGLSFRPNVDAIRPTEWPVTNHGQVIDVTQGPHGFMSVTRVRWIDKALDQFDVDVLVPTGSNQKFAYHGKRFPYSGVFRPGYFAFRWSIIDPTDDREQRITGPLSNIVSLSQEVFPFLPDYMNGGQATAKLDPRSTWKMSQFWIGSVSRLPR